ncbi:MAG: hypothetical protein AAF719_08055 [Pseudomonadota bacterium]
MGKIIFFALVLALIGFFLSPAWRSRVRAKRNKAADAAEEAVVRRLKDYKKKTDRND